MRQKIAEYAKLIAALIGAAVTSFSTLIPAEWAPWATAAAAFLTAVAVLLVPNAPTARQQDAVKADLAPLSTEERGVEIEAAWARANLGKHAA